MGLTGPLQHPLLSSSLYAFPMVLRTFSLSIFLLRNRARMMSPGSPKRRSMIVFDASLHPGGHSGA